MKAIFKISIILLSLISISHCSGSNDSSFPQTPIPSNLSFDCGGVQTCNVFLPLCEASTGGANPSPTTHSCQGLPELCVTSYSCECLAQTTQFASHSCQTGSNGEITLSIQNP